MNSLEINRLVVRGLAVALALAVVLGAIWGVVTFSTRPIVDVLMLMAAFGVATPLLFYGAKGRMRFFAKPMPWWSIYLGGFFVLMGIEKLTGGRSDTASLVLGIGFTVVGGMHLGVGLAAIKRSSAA